MNNKIKKTTTKIQQNNEKLITITTKIKHNYFEVIIFLILNLQTFILNGINTK